MPLHVVGIPPSPVALRRIALGLQQEDVRRLTGLAQSTISRVERGHDQPRRRTRALLAMALCCNVGDLWPPERVEARGESSRASTATIRIDEIQTEVTNGRGRGTS
jgi:transcriptional regulator with XRE-family HTH domain